MLHELINVGDIQEIKVPDKWLESFKIAFKEKKLMGITCVVETDVRVFEVAILDLHDNGEWTNALLQLIQPPTIDLAPL